MTNIQSADGVVHSPAGPWPECVPPEWQPYGYSRVTKAVTCEKCRPYVLDKGRAQP